ncbi:unnamed protein product [Diamesa hyperborea]
MEYFIENENHTLVDYQFRCRVCVMKVEINDSSKITEEVKAHFYAITGLKLRSSRNFSTVICSMCKRDLDYSFYFKDKAIKIQTYLNKKSGSDSDEECVVLEGITTFDLDDNEETIADNENYELQLQSISEEYAENEKNKVPESINDEYADNENYELQSIIEEDAENQENKVPESINDEYAENEENEKPESINDEYAENKITDVVPKRLIYDPVVKCIEDLKIVASTCETIPKTKKEVCDSKNPGPLKAQQYKQSIVNNGEGNKKKKENKIKAVRKAYKPKTVFSKPKESNAKNESININKIQNPKAIKKEFPPLSARRKSVRNINREMNKIEIPVSKKTVIKKNIKIEPMLTRSKSNPKGPKKVVPFNVSDWMTTPKQRKVPGMFVCPKCLQLFTFKCNLLRHQRDIHQKISPKIKERAVIKSPIKPHQCKICMKFYETPTLLSNHELSVHNKKRYCKYMACKQFFHTKFDLKFHVASHLNNNNNVENICEHCGLFNEEQSIKRHKQLHMQPKFHCSICQQAFKLIKSLGNHLKSVHYYTEAKMNNTFGGIRNRGRKNSII